MMFEREDDEDAADKIFAAAGDVIVAGRMTLAAPVAAVVGGIFVSRLTSLLSRKWKSLSLRWIIRPHSFLPSCCLVSPIILNVRR